MRDAVMQLNGFTERHWWKLVIGATWTALLISTAMVSGCVHNAPPNTGITTMDSFPKLDSMRLRGRIAQADAIISGTVVKSERQETYEDMCALTCRLRGGSEPPRFYYNKIQVDSLITRRDATEVKTGGERWVAWGVRPGDWMPGVGLKALFLVRKHCWEDFGKELGTRAQSASFYVCDTMWSLADLRDVQDTALFAFAWAHRNQLGTRSEDQ